MDCNLYQSLGQVSSDQAGVIFRDFLRGSVREMICEVIAAEVEDLCGPKHSPTGGDTFRSGSSSGRVLIDGQRESVTRPRVRRRRKDGLTAEVLSECEQSGRASTVDRDGSDGGREHTRDAGRSAGFTGRWQI